MVKVLLFYRDFSQVDTTFCHVGLGVNAQQTQAVLSQNNVDIKIFGVTDSNKLDMYLDANRDADYAVIEAPVWVWINKLDELTRKYPTIQFLVRLHSQLAFLATEPAAIKAIRDIVDLGKTRFNLKLATNSKHIKNWVETVFNEPCVYLPNLYDVSTVNIKHKHPGRVLKISSFGALRVAKNHTTAAAAAQILARKRGQDLEFHINVNREEHGKGVLDSLHNMFNGVFGVTLVEDPWTSWPDFRKLIGSMDLSFQVSTTESFNIVTADAIAEGVPCVVGPAIEWAPDNWKAEPDFLERMVSVGDRLLNHSKTEAQEGFLALEHFVSVGLDNWLNYLGV